MMRALKLSFPVVVVAASPPLYLPSRARLFVTRARAVLNAVNVKRKSGIYYVTKMSLITDIYLPGAFSAPARRGASDRGINFIRGETKYITLLRETRASAKQTRRALHVSRANGHEGIVN